MIRKHSFDLAMDFLEEELWREFSDCDIFAVKLPEDRIGYCMVMGMMGTHRALAVFRGVEDLRSLKKFLEFREDNPDRPDQMFYLHGENCLQCYFDLPEYMSQEEEKEALRYFKKSGIQIKPGMMYPSLSRWQERRNSYPVTRSEEDDLVIGLEAALYICDHLEDFPNRNEQLPWGEEIPLLYKKGRSWIVETTIMPEIHFIDYLIPNLPDSSIMDFIRRKPVSSAADLTLSLRVLTMHVNQGLSEEDPAPFYPLMIAIFDGQYFHRPIISPGLCQEDYDTMLEELAEILSDADFRPEHIEVDSEHASYFLMDFCNELGIELIEFESIPEIDDFFDHMEEDMFDPAAIIQQIHEIAAEHPEVRDIVDQFMEAHQGEELNPQLLAELFSKIIPQEE